MPWFSSLADVVRSLRALKKPHYILISWRSRVDLMSLMDDLRYLVWGQLLIVHIGRAELPRKLQVQIFCKNPHFFPHKLCTSQVTTFFPLDATQFVVNRAAIHFSLAWKRRRQRSMRALCGGSGDPRQLRRYHHSINVLDGKKRLGATSPTNWPKVRGSRGTPPGSPVSIKLAESCESST